MKQGRTPDRVHVVRPPEGDYRPEVKPAAPLGAGGLPAPQNSRAMEIIRTLAQISDKLKRSEAERYELLAELREYRKSLNELEDRAEKSEKAYLSLETKMKTRDAGETESAQRQVRFERALKDAENKLVQASAGQTLLDNRLKAAEEFQAGITTRIDETISQQARLDRQIEKIGQDKSRMLRKVERMEEILTETQDTLKARALVLLTDQSNAAQGLAQIPAYGERPDIEGATTAPWWRRSVRMQGVGMASMVVAALLFGWAINEMQQPEMPKIAVLENGGLAKLDLEKNRWEQFDTNAAAAQKQTPVATADQTPAPVATATTEPTLTPLDARTVQNMNDVPDQTPAAQEVLHASDDDLMRAMDESPDALAAKLNEIAPAAQKELETTEPLDTAAVKMPAGVYNPLAPFAARAFKQDADIAKDVAADKGTGALAARIAVDTSLPPKLQPLQTQAFAGVPEAQHDLAAIYTAGRGGVTQNFEKAAQWFREAADNGVANAAYNLGVLYHQGLGVDKDLDRALYWYRNAAKQNHPEAEYNLGIAHIEGIGTVYDAPLAAAYFEAAANQGVVEAAYNLGLIYENGLIGGAPKAEEALMWYKIAADGGSNDAKAALTQLSGAMKISPQDLDQMVKRMQANYADLHGRTAGPAKKS